MKYIVRLLLVVRGGCMDIAHEIRAQFLVRIPYEIRTAVHSKYGPQTGGVFQLKYTSPRGPPVAAASLQLQGKGVPEGAQFWT